MRLADYAEAVLLTIANRSDSQVPAYCDAQSTNEIGDAITKIEGVN